MKMIYRNYRGEVSLRDVHMEPEMAPRFYHAEADPWHGDAWIMEAFDNEKDQPRNYAVKDTCFLRPTQALADVMAERIDQAERFKNDDQYTADELALAACQYASPHAIDVWPWGAEFYKPRSRREDLVRATALLLAEIERIDHSGT